MAHIILTGATGTAGAAILAHALNLPSISRISILSRRPVKLAENQPKAHTIIHTDFLKYPEETLKELQGATACIWAQGKTSRGMTEPDYTTLTHDYPVAAAKAFAGLAPSFNFVYMSGEGARTDESGMLFAKVKGKAENALLKLQEELPSLKVYNVRPAAINPEGKYLAERTPSVMDKAHTVLGNVCEVVWKSFVVSTDNLSKVCLRLAIGDGKPLPAGPGIEGDGRLVRCPGIRYLAEGPFQS